MFLVLTDQSMLRCSHGGQVRGTPAHRVKASGAAVLTAIPHFPITGCPNPPPPANTGPCMTTLALSGGTKRVRASGLPVMTQVAVFSPALTGFGTISVMSPGQSRVKAL